MKQERAKEALQQIANTYQSVRGLMNKRHPNGGHYGTWWVKLVCDLDLDHLEDICDEYARCIRPLPEGDRIIADIILAVKERMTKDQERLRTLEIRAQARKAPWRDGANRDPTCQAIRYIMRHGPVTPERLKQLEAYGAWGGPRPEWMDGKEAQDA